MNRVANDKVEIAQRVSYISNVSNAKDAEDGYEGAKTPDVLEAQGGALRSGGAPNLFSKDHIGLIMQYAAVGVVYGSLPATIYPFLQSYLNASGTQVVTASTLVVLPWSFKIFYGIVSDCFPIYGFRRRPYMLLGWGICFVMLIVMAATPVGDPYFLNPDDADVDPEKYDQHPGIEDRLNKSAPGKAGKYVLLMMFAAFGYLMSDVTADAMVVELAQREPLAVRGTTQSTIYATRTLFVAISTILTGFAFNGKEYGGSFDFSLSFPTLMLILAICLVPVLPVTWFYIAEEKRERVVFTEYMSDLWKLIQTRAVYQIIFYNFFSGIFANFSYTAASPVQRYMVHVEPINSTISDVIGNLVFLAGIAVTGKWGLHWNWRWIIVVTGVLVIALDAIVAFITIWDVFRSQWFWLGVPIAVNVPSGISFIVSTYVIVELATDGNEGAVYGLLTTVTNLSQPFSATLTKIIDQKWNMTNERIQHDDHSIRMDITESIILMYAMSVVSWFFLVMLPKQKAETQELVRTGGSSKLLGMLTIFYVFFAFVWSVMTNLMGIFDSTACLVIAGGDGC
uniref:Major facilitator superfamily (MFS) profile domain-containing protein n=1 Tax=Globisporangium ultimum (strain ATCC 200006 / CBS 805.95 / DAOM BR144) TaxID=431595 RepID=K3W6I5_GLOUD